MANRYWVGGTGTWNTVLTTNWSTTSGGAAGASAPTLASDVAIFDANSGTGNYTVTLASAVCLTLTITNPAGTGNTLTFAGTGLQIGITGTSTISSSTGNILFSNTLIDLYSSFTVSTPTFVSLNCTTLNVRTGGTCVISTSACSASCNVTINNSGGATSLGSDFTTTGSFTITAGQLTITGRTLTCDSFVHSGQLVTGTTGVVNITGTSGTVFNIALSTATMTATNTFNLTGSPSSATTRTVSMVASSTAVINLNVQSGSDLIAIPTACNVGNLNFTGFSGDITTTAVINMTGNLTLSSTMTVTDAAAAITFVGTTATAQTITSNGVALNRTITFNTSGTGGVSLADAFTTTRAITQAGGTLNINSQTLTGLTYSNTNTSAATLTFGASGKIYCTGTGTVFSIAATSTFTLTGGISDVYITSTGSTAITASGRSGGTEAQSISFSFTGGTYALTLTTNVKNLNFTGFAGSVVAGARTIYGNLTLSSGMTVTGTASVTTFSGSSGTKTITSNGTSLNCNITFDGAGSTFKFLTASDNSGRAVILTNGIVDLNGQTVTYGSVTTAAGTKNITFNGGYLYLIGSVGFANSVPTGFTTTAGTANGFIYMAYALAKNFVGGGSSFAATLVQAAAGALTVSGSNTFLGGLTNTTQPAPIAFTSSTTNTFNGDIKLKGTAGKLIVITAVTAGTAATWSHTGSTVSCDYVSIKDNTASGTVPFYAGAHSTLVSNTTNWSNRPPPSANTEFLVFLQ